MQPVPCVRILVDVLVLILLFLPIPLIFVHVQPYQRGFHCGDMSIRYPFKKGTISSEMLYSVGTILPLMTIAIIEAYRTFVVDPRISNGGEPLKPRYSLMKRPIPNYVAALYFYLGYFFFGMIMNFIITDLGKYTIGRLRPHFLDVCRPNLTTTCTDPYVYIRRENLTCFGDVKKIRAAQLSFPSGHSSFSAYTMFYMIFYLHSRMIFPVGGFLTKHVLQFFALFLTVATALSRISDYKHHWSDVLTGFLLGVFMAYITASYVAGFFRRPQYVFGSSGPYDQRQYTGGQLDGDWADTARLIRIDQTVDGKEMV